MTYPLAAHGIFRTIQGEGSLLGIPMVFIRLAGCSIGCPLCDTDYSVGQRLTTDRIVEECKKQASGLRHPWVWITGGEPTDHDLLPLVQSLRETGLFVALATAGHKRIPDELTIGTHCVHHLSVSPHEPEQWMQFIGTDLKLVPGLKGHHLLGFAEKMRDNMMAFGRKFVVPCAGKPETVLECQRWVEDNPGWEMGVQAHKQWGIP